jgi:hypothetical protein
MNHLQHMWVNFSKVVKRLFVVNPNTALSVDRQKGDRSWPIPKHDQNPPGMESTGCVKPERSVDSISAGELRLLSLRSSSS